jgi:hypothetical protein
MAAVGVFTATRQPSMSCQPSGSIPALVRIQQFFAQAQFNIVASWSQRLLQDRSQPALCAAARTDVASYWYWASILKLVSMPRPIDQVPPNPLTLHEVRLSWETVERQGDDLGVPASFRMPSRVVSTLAANEGQPELAVIAFRNAWQSGTVTQSDLAAIGRYTKQLAAWGRILTNPAFPQSRAQGAQMLATANSIATLYGLADPSSCVTLRTLGYPDCTRVAPDPDDPVLRAAAK